MGKIIISDNVSFDGVIQDPAGDEGFRLGGWAGRPPPAKRPPRSRDGKSCGQACQAVPGSAPAAMNVSIR